MQEEWVKWVPTPEISERYYIIEIRDGSMGFMLLLAMSRDPKQQMVLLFKNSVQSYTHTDESFEVITVEELAKKYGTEFYSTWNFFKVINSRYIQKLSEKSYGFADSLSLMHFVCIDSNSITHIIASYEPTVAIFSENQRKAEIV